MGYEIYFQMSNDKEIKLTYFGEYIYENIIFPTFVDSIVKMKSILKKY